MTTEEMLKVEEAHAALMEENDRLRAGIAAIQQATIDGKVCDDVAWFDMITTLYDYCAELLEQKVAADPSEVTIRTAALAEYGDENRRLRAALSQMVADYGDVPFENGDMDGQQQIEDIRKLLTYNDVLEPPRDEATNIITANNADAIDILFDRYMNDPPIS
jgi:hypothetical protein